MADLGLCLTSWRLMIHKGTILKKKKKTQICPKIKYKKKKKKKSVQQANFTILRLVGMTHFITIHVSYWHSDITKDPSFLFILLEARKTKSTSKYLNWRLTQNPSKRISKNHYINQVIMRCHEEYITIEPLLVNSECIPKKLNQKLPFETDENTKASSFKHNWLVDIHLKQLIGMPCMLFPALHSF